MSSRGQTPPSAQVLPVAATLTNPTANSSGTTATLGVTTDQPGLWYWVLPTTNVQPSEAQIQAGQDANGAPVMSGAVSVQVPGVLTTQVSGLGTNETFYPFYMQANARFLASNIVGAPSITTSPVILAEDGSYILAEDGSKILTE